MDDIIVYFEITLDIHTHAKWKAFITQASIESLENLHM